MEIPIPPITRALALVVLASVPLCFAAARRGGRFRGLPAWVGFWGVLGSVLILLARARPWVSLPVLALVMFAGLREYFFLAPLRPRDRWAILLAYGTIPLALVPALTGGFPRHLAALAVLAFLLLPIALAIGSRAAGLLESLGRFWLGLLAFVYCAAHLGLLAGSDSEGATELFGVLVVTCELPQRLAGRLRPGESGLRRVAGLVAGAALATGAGGLLGPLVGLEGSRGALAGVLVAAGATVGAVLAEAVVQDLELVASATRVGRGALLDRSFPAVWAAPAFSYYVAWVKGLL